MQFSAHLNLVQSCFQMQDWNPNSRLRLTFAKFQDFDNKKVTKMKERNDVNNEVNVGFNPSGSPIQYCADVYQWIVLPISCTSIPLPLCCDRFDHGSRQESVIQIICYTWLCQLILKIWQSTLILNISGWWNWIIMQTVWSETMLLPIFVCEVVLHVYNHDTYCMWHEKSSLQHVTLHDHPKCLFTLWHSNRHVIFPTHRTCRPQPRVKYDISLRGKLHSKPKLSMFLKLDIILVKQIMLLGLFFRTRQCTCVHG